MASRMLHYVIANEIGRRVFIDDMDRFVIGSLLPDASRHEDGSYNIAHFRDKRGINCALFERKYEKEILKDSLYLGYLCHLIADMIWYKRITDKYVRIYPKKERITYIQKGYEDFRKLNSLLVDEYSISCPILKLPEIEVEEIMQEMVEEVIEAFKEDFKSGKNYDNYDFSVYPYDDVKAFVTETIEVCVKEISAVGNSDEIVDFSVYRKAP